MGVVVQLTVIELHASVEHRSMKGVFVVEFLNTGPQERAVNKFQVDGCFLEHNSMFP